MRTIDILNIAKDHLCHLAGHTFEVLSIEKPVSIEAAINLSKVISKLSPLLGNLIEFNTVEYLNDQKEFDKYGKWKRQDPGFPDTIFEGSISPTPGFEIKACLRGFEPPTFGSGVQRSTLLDIWGEPDFQGRLSCFPLSTISQN